jgi:glutamate formiminotransferase/formiminotetrahydrofolate cyclodeaminase
MSSSVSSSPGSRSAVADVTAHLNGIIAAVAGTSTPPPAGGSVAAAAGALAAALAQMVAGLTTGRPKYAHVADDMQDAARRAAALASELSTLVERDAAAYGAVAQAYKLPKGIGNAALTRYGSLQRAIMTATESPLAIAQASAAVAVLAADIAERGNTNAVADAAVATLLAEAVCRAAALTVRVNIVTLADASIAQRFTEEATDFTKCASEAAARALSAVEREC